ncbi:MAG: malto-oligosyltrehalose trehalohydrolase [Firmicutes bacterium HGW-Firmicutes-13]|nr:MAG: malto-oligosyltrehalose trehalohydrolase [Firmicutes bacterium HGW-Firmicutes-13]
MKKIGPVILDRGKSKIQFRVFACNKKKVSLIIKVNHEEKVIPMQEEDSHLYSTIVEGAGLNLLYKFRLDHDGDFPDPYSNFQPFGVHGFSRVIDHPSYQWKDTDWKGKDLEELIIYEIHVGTFTEEGTFKTAADRLDYLKESGINAVELMPVVQTPGQWNWGYDGANLFSVNKNYGTPEDLKYLVDCCHEKDISVILDVVYNHFGPEGNYLPVYGPYFTNKYKTAWGEAVNFDDEFCEYTRKMVTDNVKYWLTNYHFDGLRLDAVQTIKDESPTHILKEISAAVKETASHHGRNYIVIAETDENDVKLINPPEKDGYGIDAQWMDDLHHCIHTILTGETNGYYIDYGQIEGLEKVYQNYLYTGEYSRFWKKERGTDASHNPGHQFVVALQNHDQVGNRAQGERLASLVEFPYLKVGAGLILFSPYIPLIFMGEEYGEINPFLFFTNFEDPELKKKVSQGRREEFKDFNWDNIPDPEDDRTFYKSRLTPGHKWSRENKWIFNFYKDLISLRKTHPVLKKLDKKSLKVKVDSQTRLVEITRWNHQHKLTALFNLGKEQQDIDKYKGKQLLNSEWKQYGGTVEGDSHLLYKGNMIILA